MDQLEKIKFAMEVCAAADNCGDHPCPVVATIQEENVAEVYVAEGEPGMNDSGSEAVFKMKDGRYIYAHESSDYSGHG